MKRVFNRFYDTALEVYNENTDGYLTDGNDTPLGTVICDIQPCDSETSCELYGLSDNKAYRLYCDRTDLIRTGRRVRLDGEWFVIARVEKWKLGLSCLLKEA